MTEHVILVLTIKEAEWLVGWQMGDERSRRSIKRKANKALLDGHRYVDGKQPERDLQRARLGR